MFFFWSLRHLYSHKLGKQIFKFTILCQKLMIFNNFNFVKFHELEQVSLGLRFYNDIPETLLKPIFYAFLLCRDMIGYDGLFWWFLFPVFRCLNINFLNWAWHYFCNFWPATIVAITWRRRINLKYLCTHHVWTNSFCYFEFINVNKSN